MDAVKRLIAAGICPDCALESVRWYMTQGNDEGLERYIREVEHRVQTVQPKPCREACW